MAPYLYHRALTLFALLNQWCSYPGKVISMQQSVPDNSQLVIELLTTLRQLIESPERL